MNSAEAVAKESPEEERKKRDLEDARTRLAELDRLQRQEQDKNKRLAMSGEKDYLRIKIERLEGKYRLA